MGDAITALVAYNTAFAASNLTPKAAYGNDNLGEVYETPNKNMPLKRLFEVTGGLAEASIRCWVRLTGRRVAKVEVPWLVSPIGPSGRIGEAIYELIAQREGLKIRTSESSGLLPCFDLLKGPAFDPSVIRAEIRDFYEHTARYRLEAWSQASLPSLLFLWLLMTFVSRRMDQLNFPVSSIELAGGMSSEILELVNSGSGHRMYTGWLRRLTSSNRVIYAGFYSTQQPERYHNPCVKVSFPLPRGSATVFLRPEAQQDGSLKLISSGTGFGEPGAYRIVEVSPEHWRVRYLRTLHESFHVYVDKQAILRTEHTIRFLGLRVLQLHYKMVRDENGKR